MERGPMALFGAIVAVGLGPAMWLGAQFGSAIEAPHRPPAVTSEQNPQQRNQDAGGGAGSAPDDSVQTNPRAVVKPLAPSSANPTTSSTTRPTPPTTGPSATKTVPPSSDPTTPETESTTPPDSSPTGDDDSGTAPPSPPSSSDAGTGAAGVSLPLI